MVFSRALENFSFIFSVLPKQNSAKERLRLAIVSAITCHFLFFAAAYIVIDHLWIPSNEERALVLTLDFTPLDGVNDIQENAEETINDVALNEQASIPQTDPQAVQNILSPNLIKAEQPDFEAESPIQTQQKSEPTMVAEQSAVKEGTAEQEPSTESSNITESLIDAPVDQQLKLASSTEQTSLLSSSNIGLLIPKLQLGMARPEEAEINPVETVTISGEQQKMLNRKIKHWTENLDQLDASQEPLTWTSKGQKYVAKFSRRPANGEMDMDKISVEISTERNGQKLTTSMKMKKLAFSNFAQFVHQWDPEVAIHDDEMNGRFHSNSSIYIDANRHTQPIFHNKVTTAAYKVNMLQAGSRESIFRGGIETGVKKISMPKPALNFAGDAAITQHNSVTFEQSTRIVFQENGNYLWQPIDETGPMQARQIGDQPLYLIAARGKTLSVSGRVKGMVMLYSPRRITIEGDLSYVNPVAKDTSNQGDILGLVSAGNIVVAGKDVVGPGDLEIHASIYAKRKFIVKNYLANNHGTLRVFGSLTAGSMSATEPRYATKIVFDPRLEDMRAPGFPVTDRYEVTELDLQWEASALPSAVLEPYRADTLELQ